MLSTLKFVQGAVGKKDFIPAITHFCIEGGTIRSYNGVLALSAPIDVELQCNPKAVPFVKAIASCDDVVSLSITGAGRLKVASGKFRALIDCIDGETPHVKPTGQRYDGFDGAALVAAIARVQPFIGEDASRLWSMGVIIDGDMVYATNNVCLAATRLPKPFAHRMCIPRMAVTELLRVKEAPTWLQKDNHSVTFHFESGKWLRTQLNETSWPDFVKILSKPGNPVPIPEDLFKGLAKIKPFLEDAMARVHFLDGHIGTMPDDTGTTYAVQGLPPQGVFQHGMLQLLEGNATHCDFSTWPAPCMFRGDNLWGAIAGLRQ